MPLKPFPTQISGAEFLASRKRALLADEPRVGKTGATILAADDLLLYYGFVVTTKRGLEVWAEGFKAWSFIKRKIVVVRGTTLPLGWEQADVLIFSWGSVAALAPQLAGVKRDFLILDEMHYAKEPEAKRTMAVFGNSRHKSYTFETHSPFGGVEYVWGLSGTPTPGTLVDAYPFMRAMFPDALLAGAGGEGTPNVTNYDLFHDRFCHWRPKKIGRGPYAKVQKIRMKSRNAGEFAKRMQGRWLRRTQADVGILQPTNELWSISPTEADLQALSGLSVGGGVSVQDIMQAAETGTSLSLDAGTPELRRAVGAIKSRALSPLLRAELRRDGRKLVLMCWHQETMDYLKQELAEFNAVQVSGKSTHKQADLAEHLFKTDPNCLVFIGQIVCCGEAIDLSVSSELIFIEGAFNPDKMLQAQRRVTNYTQTKRPRVRVASLAGTVDEGIQASVVRKVASMRNVHNADLD